MTPDNNRIELPITQEDNIEKDSNLNKQNDKQELLNNLLNSYQIDEITLEEIDIAIENIILDEYYNESLQSILKNPKFNEEFKEVLIYEAEGGYDFEYAIIDFIDNSENDFYSENETVESFNENSDIINSNVDIGNIVNEIGDKENNIFESSDEILTAINNNVNIGDKEKKIGDKEKKIGDTNIEKKNETKEIFNKNLEAYNKSVDELSSAVNLDDPKYADLRAKAEKELQHSLPNLANEIPADQYKNYVDGLALMMNKDNFIKDKPELASKFEELETSSRTLGVYKEIQINKYFENNPKYTRETQETVKQLNLNSNLKMDIEYKENGANFISINESGQKEITAISKNGSIEKTISKNDFPLSSKIFFKPNYKLENQKTKLTKNIDKLQNSLQLPQLKEANLALENTSQIITDLGTHIDSSKFDLQDMESKKENLLSQMTEVDNQEDILKQIDEIDKTIENTTSDIQKLEKELELLIEMNKIQEEVAEIDKVLNEEKDLALANQNEYEGKLENRLEFLDNLGFTLFDKETLSIKMKNTNVEPIKFIDFDKPGFGLDVITKNEVEQKKIIVSVMNQMISGDKKQPLNPESEKHQNGEITSDMKKSIKHSLVSKEGKINYTKIENNLKKFNSSESTQTSENLSETSETN